VLYRLGVVLPGSRLALVVVFGQPIRQVVHLSTGIAEVGRRAGAPVHGVVVNVVAGDEVAAGEVPVGVGGGTMEERR
jgi:hypothetical protein